MDRPRASAPTVAALAVAALAGCLSESRAPARDATTGDTAPDVVVDPCSDEGAHECLSYRTARSCEGGAWKTRDCALDAVCTPATGQCAHGTYTCLGAVLCNIDCPTDQKDCGKGCNQGATVAAVDALGALNACQCQDECWPILCGKLFPWPTYAQISACVTAGCAPEGAACMGGGPTGDAGCKTVRDCILECDGDVFCAEGCMARGTPEAQVQAGFYYVCVRDACGPVPEPGCLFNVQANDCAALWDACQGATPVPAENP